MTDPAVLLALAERCEREEPSRELDSAIGHAIGWRQHPMIEGFAVAPSWTSSLDAAVTLVPKNLETTKVFYWHKQKLWQVTLWTNGKNSGLHQATGKTEPMARVAAALRALSQTRRP